MMKVLILTASTGGGHNATAQTISELCKVHSIESKIFDIFDNTLNEKNKLGDSEYIKDSFVKNNSSLYNKVIKYIPDVYKLIYYMSNNDIIKLLNRLISKHSDNLYRELLEYKPDVIVSAHPMAVSMIKRFYRKNYKMTIPYIQIVTDFHAHYIYVDDVVDAYITGSEYTNFDLAKLGTKITKTFDYGIPIKDKFIINEPNKTITNEIMIMLGSMGFEDNMQNIYDLLNNTDKKIHFITGSNQKLKEKLENQYKDKINTGQINIYGFVSNVDEIMKKVDLVITKPGGLSLSECINLKKPMILVNPIPGQEEENLKIMEIYGICKNGVNTDINKLVNEIYSNKDIFNDMLLGIERITRNYSKENVINLIKTIKKSDNSLVDK